MVDVFKLVMNYVGDRSCKCNAIVVINGHNAFNMPIWSRIVRDMGAVGIIKYLIKVVQDYLQYRCLSLGTRCVACCTSLFSS